MSHEIKLKTSSDDPMIGYLYLPDHPGERETGSVHKTIDICELIDNYKGIPLYLDFDKDGVLIGIEIVG